MTKLRVVIHAPTPKALKRARSNVRNLIASQPDCTCEIVVNASAVQAAFNNADAETDAFLRVCGNTLKATGITPPRGVHIVPAAIGYLAKRQAEGWSYVRA